MSSDLPDELRRDFADLEGAKITLVIGAGCSHEQPTALPLTDELARKVHQRLLDDEVLPGPCGNPEDLSVVADAVYGERRSQKPLVDRMDRQRFLGVEPNEGHKIAAALMQEEIVSCVITLNYDDAMSQAKGHLGATKIKEIRGPEAHGDMGTINLVYLHGKADADPDELIMRTESLEREWKDNWEEAIVRSQLIRRSSVFAGLGSPAGVLTESTKKIRKAFRGSTTFYQVDPAEYEREKDDGSREKSPFTEELNIPEERYIPTGWCEFMKAAGVRAREEQVHELVNECIDIVSRQEPGVVESFDEEAKDEFRERIRSYLSPGNNPYSLLELGQLRAYWLLESTSNYFPHSDGTVESWLAQLFVAVDYIVRRYRFNRVIFHAQDGCMRLEGEDGRQWLGYLAHGRAVKVWSNLDTCLPSDTGAARERTTEPTFVLVDGLRGSRPSAPSDIGDPAREEREGEQVSIMRADQQLTPIEAHGIDQRDEQLDNLFR